MKDQFVAKAIRNPLHCEIASSNLTTRNDTLAEMSLRAQRSNLVRELYNHSIFQLRFGNVSSTCRYTGSQILYSPICAKSFFRSLTQNRGTLVLPIGGSF